MMVIVRGNDGSHFELEEQGEGRLRAFFKEGLNSEKHETIFKMEDFPSIRDLFYRNAQLMDSFKNATQG